MHFTRLHGLTWPLNDVGRIRREFGQDIWITAVIADTILLRGPKATYDAVRDFLTPEVKGSDLSLGSRRGGRNSRRFL